MGQWGKKENQMTLTHDPNLNLTAFLVCNILKSEERFSVMLEC